GEKKLVYLRRDRGDNYTPTFMADPATPSYLDELGDACGITTQHIYPTGYTTRNAKVDCRPERYIARDCPQETTPSVQGDELPPRSAAVRSAANYFICAVAMCSVLLTL
ncbi:hypothetical protein BaRGS_00034015, partial [Batillaria attramentaria]